MKIDSWGLKKIIAITMVCSPPKATAEEQILGINVMLTFHEVAGLGNKYSERLLRASVMTKKVMKLCPSMLLSV